MSQNPIEITAKDLIKRQEGSTSEENPSGTFNPLNLMKDIKAGMAQFQEIITMAREMGIKLPGGLSLPGLVGGQETKPKNEATNPTGGNQLGLLIAFIQNKYGDITLRELLQKLGEEYGDQPISRILKGK